MTVAPDPLGRRCPSGSPAYWEALDFLTEEAAALDENRLDDWLEMLDGELDYRVPIRLTRERAAATSFSAEGMHMLEDRASMTTRVRRLATEYAWAEDPPSRTRRLVANLRVWELDDAEQLAVRSALLLVRERLDDRPQLISAERRDRLRRHPGGMRLVAREVRLDHTVLGMHNLSVFL